MTDDLISRSALKQRIIKNYRKEFFGSVLWNILDDMPTINTVPLVMCFECANRGDKRKCPMCFDESDGIDFYQVDNTDDDGFCHYGERKEDNNTTGCRECKHFNNDAGQVPDICMRCRNYSNWEWRGVQKEE